jgi:CRISPR-associated protein Cmr1
MTITPLVMNGAEGDRPELRPASIKGVLRFWWRALNGHLKNLGEEESKIFGDTKQRSKVIIRIEELPEKTGLFSLLPHKTGRDDRETRRLQSWVDAFCKKETFKIRFDFDETVISLEQLKSLFILTCTLGGFGKRSRRGFGSIEVLHITMPKTLKEILDYINVLTPDRYDICGNSIMEINPISKANNEDYPFIQNIEIGVNSKTTEDIIRAASKIHGNNTRDYDSSIGAGKPRLASPLCVTILDNGLPIITILKNTKRTNYQLQKDFKAELTK